MSRVNVTAVLNLRLLIVPVGWTQTIWVTQNLHVCNIELILKKSKVFTIRGKVVGFCHL